MGTKKVIIIVAIILSSFGLVHFTHASTGQPNFSAVTDISTAGSFSQTLGTSTDASFSGTVSNFSAFLDACDFTGTDATFSLLDQTAATTVRNVSISHLFASGTVAGFTWSFTPYVFIPDHSYAFTIGILNSGCVITLGSSDPSAWPYGEARNSTTGLLPLPVQDLYFTANFNNTGFSTPSSSTLVQLAWPPDGATVNKLFWWPISISNPIPFSSSVLEQDISVKYSLTPAGSSTTYQIDTQEWNGGLDSKGLVWIDANQAHFPVPHDRTTAVTAQAVYTIKYTDLSTPSEYDSGLVNFTIDKTVPLSTSSLGQTAQTVGNPNPYSTSSPFSIVGPIFTLTPCGDYTIPFFGTFIDPFCSASNAVFAFLNGIVDSLKRQVNAFAKGLLSVFPLNVITHLHNDIVAASTLSTATSTTIRIPFNGKNYTLISSSSISSDTQALGLNNFRAFADMLMYSFTGLLMILGAVLVVAAFHQKH